jgi:hypothetical protein
LFPNAATAEEVAVAINARSSLVEARTSNVGQNVVINAKVDVNEDIQVLGGTANSILAFPTDRKDTINLYVDDVELSKDGLTAVLDSGNTAPYDLLAVGSFPHTLNIVVDGKTANPQTATMQLVDVLDPTAVTAAEVVAVLNRDLAGITAVAINSSTSVQIQSNTLLSTSSKLHVTGGSMNSATNGLNLSTTQVVGEAGDYTFNRELGIIQLKTPLTLNQNVTLGSLFTRGHQRAAAPENYAPTAGQTLVISVDGGSNQTVTFDGTFVATQSAAYTAAFINKQLVGGTAVVRTIGGLNYLEIRTNTFDSTGSLEIQSSSTGNGAFGFTLNDEAPSVAANQAFKVSGVGPFSLADLSTLVVVMDNNNVDETYSIIMSHDGALTGATSSTVFTDSSLNTVFVNSNQIDGFYLAFLSGANTATGSVDSVALLGSNLVKYHFAGVPANFANIAVGDLANFSGMSDSENNFNGVITAKGSQDITVLNPNGVAATSQTGTALMGEKRTVSAYNAGTGQVTVSVAFSSAPSAGDAYAIIPHTTQNVVDYLNNTRLTSLSQNAEISAADGGAKIQIASLLNGSDGYVQVTGGSANTALGFDTAIYRGLAGYNYWIDLVDLVHKTIYGDDSDLVSFPGFGAAGVIFRILAPTRIEVLVNLNVSLKEGFTIDALDNEIRSAVTGYVNALGVGQALIVEEIRAAVIGIVGITDVSVITPLANIAIADNEIARVNGANILIG